MNEYSLPLSKKALTNQIVITGVVMLVACILAALFFGKVFPEARLASLLVTLTWIVLPVLWLLGSFIASKTWPRTAYVFTSDSFSVRKKGWFGSYAEELYRYETILTVTSRRGIAKDYGTITITLVQLPSITISGVEDAENQARLLKEMVAKSQPRVQAIPQ